MELTGYELEVIKALSDTIVPSTDGPTPIYHRSASDVSADALLAEAITTSLQPKNGRDLRRLLSVVQSPLYNLILTGNPQRFTSLSAAEREVYLSRWRDSSIPLKRTAFQAFKRLVCFLAYSSSLENGVNPNWADIGYPGPRQDPPVPTPEYRKLKPISVSDNQKLQCEVVVVGAGAGGSVIAESLAESGKDVIVLDQGPNENSETYNQSELQMMQKLFQQSGTAATRDLSFVLLGGKGAGGGTTVNWNTCLKPPQRVLSEWEEEFGLRGVAGDGFGRHLDEVWKAIGVNKEESQRNQNNQVLWDGCAALGYTEGADYRVIERNAVGCDQRCDFCTYGCRYYAKQSTAVTYLPEAQARGERFVFDARVDRVVIEGGTAKGVSAVQSSGNKRTSFEVEAKAVVLACGGIETPALLLRSGINDKNVGRFLRLDPTVAVGGIFEKPIDVWKGPPQTVAVWKFIDLDGTHHGFWVEAAPAHPGLFALSIPWVNGRQHKEFMQKYYSHSSASIVLLRERSSGRVDIDKEGYPSVTYDLEAKDRETLVTGMEETARILIAAGGTGVWTTHNEPVFAGDGTRRLGNNDLDSFSASVRSHGVSYNRMMLFSAHLMGSCRMSADPARGPTAPSGELHTVKNLFIGDACVFPTTPAVNPMITIMAMARQTAESIRTTLN